MDALWLAGAAASGVWLAHALGGAGAPLVALMLLGIAAGRRGGACLALGSASWLAAVLATPSALELPAGLDPARPVEALVSASSPWRPEGEGWQADARLRRLRQGARVWLVAAPLRVQLAAGAPPGGAGWRCRGYLVRGAEYWNRPLKRGGPWRLAVKTRRHLQPAGGDVPLLLAARRRLEARFAALPPTPGVALVRALTVADRSRLPPGWSEGLRRLGLSHLLALSGLHLGLLSLWVHGVVRPAPPVVRSALVIAAIWVFVAVAGAPASLLRAALVTTGFLLCLPLRRRQAAHQLLAVAACTVSVARPQIWLDLGFQLSLAASAGMVLMARLRRERRDRWWSRPFWLSLGAQLAVLPIVLPHFAFLQPASPLLGMIAVPLFAALLALLYLWFVLLLVWPQAASAGLWMPGLAAGFFARLSELPLPAIASAIYVPMVPAILVLWLTWSLWRRRGAIAAMISMALLLAFLARPRHGAWDVAALDVGQGDAFVLRDGSRALLVDGGGWRRPGFAAGVLIPALAGAGIARVEVALVSHADLDHCGGVAELAGRGLVEQVWVAPGWGPSACRRALFARPASRLRFLQAPARLRWRRWQLEVLHPGPLSSGDGNGNSLVVRATVGERALLLTGDIGADVEGVLAQAADLRSGTLKVAHHGSRFSTSPLWLDRVRPRLALISAGRGAPGVGNPYGHPHPTVLRRLRDRGVTIWRTDLHGQVRLTLGAHGTGVRTVRAPGPREYLEQLDPGRR